MRRLKIGILGTRGIPNHYGGFEQFAEYLSFGLVQRGHDVYVYNSAHHPYQQREWNDVQIIHCKDPEPALGTAGQFFYDLNCINDARKRNFDVLLHLGYTSDSVWHWRWPKNTVNIVNMDGLEWMRSKYSKPTKLFLRLAEKLAARNAQVLIADSWYMKEYLRDRYQKQAVYIPYGAEEFVSTDLSAFRKHRVSPGEYFLLIARMEPENNIEMIIKGYLLSKHPFPLLVVGDTSNAYGKKIRAAFPDPSIQFCGSIYEQSELNHLRFHSAKYFHGHSVGGTNPSLLEAMACRCDIAAHKNSFNRAILKEDAHYFSTAGEVATVISMRETLKSIQQRKQSNISKIKTVFSQQKNINDYEQLMFMAANKEKEPEMVAYTFSRLISN